MTWIENPSSRNNSEAEQKLAEQKKLRELQDKKPSETTQDVRTKEVFHIALPVIKEALGKQKQIMEQMITELKTKEYNVTDNFSGMMKSLGNFTSPDNYMGFSTLQKWEWQLLTIQTWHNFQWKTNTGERLDTVENFQARSNIVFSSLLRLEYALSSGQRMEDIQKDPSMVAFFMSPEAKYMTALSGGIPVDTAMQEYNLRKARNLKDFIINWDILAESYYDKLKWTPYEAQADKERMGKLAYARKKWLTDFGNTFLSLDQFGLLVTWWAIGKWVWATIAMSPKLAQVSVQATDTFSTGKLWIATRALPWVNVVKTQAGEWLATTLTKFGVNFPLEIGKFAWYESIAKQFWGDDTAKIVAMLMMVMPWTKEGFASSLRAKVAKEWKQIQAWEVKWEFVKWIQTNYWEDKAKQMLYAGLVEAKMQSGKIAKTGYDAEVGSAVEKMIAELRTQVKAEPVKKVVTEATAQAIPRRKLNQMWAVLVWGGGNKPKPTTTGTESPRATQSEVPKEQPKELLPETTDTTKQVRDKVANVVGDSPEMTELLKAGLPRGYILALKEHWVNEASLLQMKWWSGKKPEEVDLINNAIRTHNQDALQNNRPDLMLTPEEWHAIYGYSTNLFFKTLNGALWRNEWGKLSLTSILKSGLDKMPLAKPTQYRGDNHLLNDMLQGRPVSRDFLESPEWIKFLTELEWRKFILKGFISSANNPADTFLEEGGIKYYLTIQWSSAKDITPLAIFPNFGDKLKVSKLQPDGTKALEFGKKTSQESVFPPWTEIVINKAKRDEINGNTFISIEASEVPKK